MKSALCAFAWAFCLAFYGGPVAAQVIAKDYWVLTEYVQRHKDQSSLMDAFDAAVQRASEPTESSPETQTISIIYPGLQVSDYWRRSVASFRARMDELQIPYVIEEHFTKPGSQIRKQEKLIRKVLLTKPDFLIFTLDAFRHRELIELVLKDQHTKVFLQNITTPLKAFEDEQPSLYVGFDHETGTLRLADQYIKEFPNGARYAVLFGPEGYVSKMRGQTFIDRMNEQGNMELLSSYYVNFDRSRAKQATLSILEETPDIDFIYACSTDIAFGVIDALKETGRLGQVKVNGWGGGASELDAILAQDLDFTIMRMNDDNGVAMAEAVKLSITDQGDQIPVVYSGEMKLVDQAMTTTQIDQLRDRAFRYSR